MSKRIIFLFCFFVITVVSAQEINETVVVAAFGERNFQFPAYKNTTLTIAVKKKKGAKIAEIAVVTYQNKVVFKEENFKKLEEEFLLTEESLYTIRIKNKSKKALTYSIIASTKSKDNRVASIGYKAKKDTTYGYQTKQYRKVSVLKSRKIQEEKYYLNSRSNALLKGGKCRIIVPISLPKNTVEWHYTFTASREENDITNTLNTFNLAAELTTFLKKENSLKGAVQTLNTPPGANICDIYLFDEKNAKLFKDREDYDYKPEGTRENFKSGIVSIKDNLEEKIYLGINNSDNLHGIHLGIEVVAIVQNEQEILETINIPIITSYSLPYVK